MRHPTRHRRADLAVLGLAAALLTACAPQVGGAAAPSDEAALQVAMGDAPVAPEVVVTADGLVPGAAATLWTRMVDADGRAWSSWGRFTADAEGGIDPAAQAPEAGTWDGVDPHGLWWSARLPAGVPADPPYPTPDGDVQQVTVGLDGPDGPIARTEVERTVFAQEATAEQVDVDGMVADLYLPSGEGPHPGVILLGGSEGGRPSPHFGRMLAAEGFATLGLAYFGTEDLPAELVRIPLEYGLDAIDHLAAHDAVADVPIGIIGASKGAELGLNLGARHPDVGGVVAYVGTGVSWSGIPTSQPTDEQMAEGIGSSWTYQGEDVPHLEVGGDVAGFAGVLGTAAAGRPVRIAMTYDAGLAAATPQEVAEATIPVEDVDGPVLLVSGGDDAVWGSTPLSALVEDRAAEAGVAERVQHLAYPDAGHFLLDLPHQPASHAEGFPFLPGVRLAGGGAPAANAAAIADAWPQAVATLHEATEEAAR